MSYNLVNPTTGALTKVSGNITSNIIPANASASNKLVAKSDTVKRKDVAVTATASIEDDIKTLLDTLIAEPSGVYAGYFTRTGNTSGHYSVSIVGTWNVVGIVSICGATSAAYRVAKFKNTEQGAYTYKVEQLVTESDNTSVKWIGSAGNMTLAQIFSTYAQQNTVMYKGYFDWQDSRVPLYGQGADTVEITCYDWNLTATTIHGKTFYYNSSTGVWIENSPIVTTTASIQSDSAGNIPIYSVLPASAYLEIISIRSLDIATDCEYVPGRNYNGDWWCQIFSWTGVKVTGVNTYNIEIKYRRLA